MSDNDDLAAAHEAWQAAAKHLGRDSSSAQEKADACVQIQKVIVQARSRTKEWGVIGLTALQGLGRYLAQTKRATKGRRQMSDTDIYPPTLAELGISDRHLAADAVAVAKISDSDFT